MTEQPRQLVEVKPWYKSSTLIVNFIGIAVMLLTVFVDTGITNDQEIVGFILAVINILNRIRSTIAPVTLN